MNRAQTGLEVALDLIVIDDGVAATVGEEAAYRVHQQAPPETTTAPTASSFSGAGPRRRARATCSSDEALRRSSRLALPHGHPIPPWTLRPFRTSAGLANRRAFVVAAVCWLAPGALAAGCGFLWLNYFLGLSP